MSLTVYKELEQGSQAWLEARAGIVTASVVGNLITAKTLQPSTGETARSLTAHLVAERITGYVEPSFSNADTERGHMSEPYARDLYAEHKGVDVEQVGFIKRTEDDYTAGWSPDGLIGADGALEIKAPRAKTHIKTMLEDRIPPVHMPQIQMGLFVSGRSRMDFVSYAGGHPLFIRSTLAIPAWQKAIEAAVEHFEQKAAKMIAAYHKAGHGMPVATRIDFEEEIRL